MWWYLVVVAKIISFSFAQSIHQPPWCCCILACIPPSFVLCSPSLYLLSPGPSVSVHFNPSSPCCCSIVTRKKKRWRAYTDGRTDG
ncbi:hypothetical protein BKA57DRAFT_457305 [Linnemannia elongata]|nr:hypothetical protein BKA57DRAFT_457305 [Linnemannia elongata]